MCVDSMDIHPFPALCMIEVGLRSKLSNLAPAASVAQSVRATKFMPLWLRTPSGTGKLFCGPMLLTAWLSVNEIYAFGRIGGDCYTVFAELVSIDVELHSEVADRRVVCSSSSVPNNERHWRIVAGGHAHVERSVEEADAGFWNPLQG